MERPELLAFLEAVGAGSLESYLSLHGDDPFAGLEERLQWAAWNFRDPEHARESSFLMQHHDDLRAVLDEGETAWHLRVKREQRAAKPTAPPTPLGLGTARPVPGRTVASVTPPPVRDIGPTVTPAPAPKAEPPPRGPPAPSFSDLEAVVKPPPPSEQATEIRVANTPQFDGEPTLRRPPPGRPKTPKTRRGGEAYKPAQKKRARHELGNLLEIPIDTEDVPLHHQRGGLGLGIEKTGYGESEPAAPQRRYRSGGTPNYSPPPANPDNANMSILMLGAGLAVAGIGAIALAGAIVFGVVQTKGNDPPPPPPPSMQDVLPSESAN